MAIIGKLHEISMYGLISAIISLVSGKASISSLAYSGFHVTNFSSFFLAFMFWASIAFVPIAIIGAFSTKYGDGGEGLSFHSNNFLVILFAHIAEEIIGLIATPFWFLKDVFTHNLHDGWKVFDYISYLIVIIFIIVGFISIW